MTLCGFISEQARSPVEPDYWQPVATAKQNHTLESIDISGTGVPAGRIYHAADAGNVLSDETMCFAIAGDFAWRDEGLRTIAERNGNAAALQSAWQQSGTNSLDLISGGFAAAILDKDSGRLTLGIDRMGIGRMAYRLSDGAIAFSTRIGDLTHLGGRAADLRPQALFEFLFFHQIPSPGSIYSGIHKLCSAEVVQIASGRVERRRYWRPRFRGAGADHPPTIDELLGLCRTSIGRNVNTRSIATFLSGGLDSSMVTALASKVFDVPLTAVSIGFDAPGFDEMHYAKVVASQLSVHHEQYYVTSEDVRLSAPRIAVSCDEPFGNASIIPTYYCASVADAGGHSLMLAGDGGDELFGGNERYARQHLFEMFGVLPDPLQSAAGWIAARCRNSSMLPLRKLASFVEQARIPLPDRLESYNLMFRTELQETFSPEFIEAINPEEPLEMLREVFGSVPDADSLNRMLYLDWKFTLADNDLRKVTTGTTLAGPNVRFPLLDLDIVDFSLRLKSTEKLRGKNLRPFFREAAATILPRETIKKHKHGFGLPFGLWMLNDPRLRSLADDAVASFKRRNILKPAYIDWLKRQHVHEHASYFGSAIWAIMMLEFWLDDRNIQWQ